MQEINADIAAILKDADPPNGKTLEDLYQEYRERIKLACFLTTAKKLKTFHSKVELFLRDHKYDKIF